MAAKQVVTRRGVATAVVLSMEQFRRLETNRPPLGEFLLAGPKFDDDVIALINERSADTGRMSQTVESASRIVAKRPRDRI